MIGWFQGWNPRRWSNQVVYEICVSLLNIKMSVPPKLHRAKQKHEVGQPSYYTCSLPQAIDNSPNIPTKSAKHSTRKRSNSKKVSFYRKHQ